MPAPDRATALLTAARASRSGRPGADGSGGDADPGFAWARARVDPVEPDPSTEPLTRLRGPQPRDMGGSVPGVPAHAPGVGNAEERSFAPTPPLTRAEIRASASGRRGDRPPARSAEPAHELPSHRLVRARDGVLEVPSGLTGARVSPPWRAVAGAGVVVVLALASLAFALWRGDSAPEPVPTSVRTSGPHTRQPSGQPTPTASGPGTTAAAPTAIPGATAAPATEYLVHVVGQVRRPRVVTVPAGARVSDAITAAGGPTDKAVLSGLNLARPVVDGEQVVVPDKNGASVPVNTMPPPPNPGAPPAAAGGASAGAAGLVDLNTADEATLDTLPGVGPSLARRIIEWRTTHGRFTSVDDLDDVDGVGEKTMERLRPRVRV